MRNTPLLHEGRAGAERAQASLMRICKYRSRSTLSVAGSEAKHERGEDRGKGFSSLGRSCRVVSLDQIVSLVNRSPDMYSPETIHYCPNGLAEVPRSENDFVLDLRVKTQDETNGERCHGEQMYLNGLHSPEPKLCNLSPTMPLTPSATTRNGKPTRPFKAYAKNFLGLATAEGIIDDSEMRFLEFRRQCLSQIHAATGGSTGNKNMKRPVQSIRPAQSISPTQLPSSSIKDQNDLKDQAYWERRRKNNEAAKKSRDARRAKEDEIAIRAAFLERENLQLRLELASLKGEVERLRCVLYGKK